MKRITAIIITAFLLLFLAGCGEKDNKPNAEKNTAQEEKISKKPQKGGSITIYSYKPDTLCPLLSKNNANIRMLSIVFDSLFTVDDNLSAVPCLASSWSSSEENTKYTVELKDNVLFHDGSTLNAEDVVFSVETAKSEPEGAFYHNVSVIKSVRAIGNSTVEFTLTKPLSRFVNLLDFPVIKKQSGAVDRESYVPIGTGGFLFENRNEGNLYHLVRNDSWWGGEIYLDSVKVRLLPDKDTAVYAFSSGEISLCPAEGYEWGKLVDAQTASYKEYKTEYYNFIGINHKNKLLAKDEVRKALLHIIDREKILKSGAPGFSEASNAPLRSEWIYLREKKLETAKELNKAKELLEGGGWTLQSGVYKKREGRNNLALRFEILINEESYKKEQFAKSIAEELSEFGILATVKKLPYDKYEEAVRMGRYDMFIGSMNLSKELDFEYMFTDGNVFFLKDEELLAAARNMQLSSKEEEIAIKAGEFIKLFNEKVPFIGIGFENSVLLYKSNIFGEINPVSNNIYNGIENLYVNVK